MWPDIFPSPENPDNPFDAPWRRTDWNSPRPTRNDFLLAALWSPGELRVYDSQNRVTGLVNGEVKEEIPNSEYDEQNETVFILSPSDTYRYEVIGIGEDTYGLDITLIENGEAVAFAATEVPITSGAKYEYTIDWDALSQNEPGVDIKIDKDGDGIFEDTITTSPPYQPSAPSPSIMRRRYL